MTSTKKNFRSSEENLIPEEERERFLTPLSQDNVITKRNNVIEKNEEHRLNVIVREENEDINFTDVDFEKKQYDDIDNIISTIGMGKFQKRLLVLCGFGWFADVLWIMCVAVILPRVQVHFKVPNSVIGLLSSSQFFGMMFGAIFWGMISDNYGRRQAFGWTLGVTVFFGFSASLSQSFRQLCFLFFMLGFGVGGTLPVDGVIFLEFVPKEHQYLLTFSSIFFESGAVFASLVGYFVLPSHSCFEEIANCDVSKENNGWRYVIVILGICTLIMLIIRVIFFRRLESPKFLISHNRKQEAMFIFQEIARINESQLDIQLNDLSSSPNQISPTYPLILPDSDKIHNKSSNKISTHLQQKFISKFSDIKFLFSKKWITTTMAVWSMWGILSFGTVMFNIYLPKYLENLDKEENKLEGKILNGSEAIRDSMKGFMIYSIWGIPGSIIASYLVESFLGRKGTMILAAVGTSISMFLFTNIQHHYSIVLFSMIIGCLKSMNWSVINCYTPEVFESKIRGTACGIAAVFARIAGMISPVVTGTLISHGVSIPLYTASFVFGLLAILISMLPIETRGRQA